MNENKKILIVVGVMIGLLGILIIVGLLQKNSENKNLLNNENKENVSYNGKYSTDYEKAFEGENKKVLFIGSSSCSVCSEFTPQIKYLSEAYHFTYYYIDAATIKTEELEKVLEKLGQNIENIGTPYIAFLENGEKYEEVKGYLSEEGLFTTLQKNGIIEEGETYISSSEAEKTNTTDDDSNLTFIDYEKYKEILAAKEKSIVVLGQTGCGACTSFKPIINEIAKEYGITIYFANLTDWNQSEISKLMDSLSYFKERESFGTPLTLILENGDNIAEQQGYNSKETTVSFFQKNGFIKEN